MSKNSDFRNMPASIALLVMSMLLVSFCFSCVFVYKIAGSAFSPKLRKEISNKPFRHFLMVLAIPIFIGLIFLWNPWPLKLHTERKMAMERVQQAGGWSSITKDCLLLANQHTNDAEYIWLQSSKANSEPLPPALAALNPYEIRYYPYDSVPIIRIHVLGHHNTDNAWPEYWLWFICREMPENYKPEQKYKSQWFPLTIRKMTNSIFEITD